MMQIDNTDILTQFIEGVREQIGENMKQQGSYVTGKTFSLIVTEVDAANNKARIIDNSGYFKTLIYGRGPTRSGGSGSGGFLQQIKDWVIAKGIQPYPDAKGKTPSIDSLAYMIYRSINKKGTWLSMGNKGMVFGTFAPNPTELLQHGIRPEREDVLKTTFQTKYKSNLIEIVNQILNKAA